MESRTIPHEGVSVFLAECIRECWRDTPTDAGTLQLDVDSDFVVEADRSQLKRLFGSLFENMIQYADNSVYIRIGTLRNGFVVSTDGLGISIKDREKAFESGLTTANNGDGFRLAIVRQIVGAHGWEIQLIEGVDGGTELEIIW